MTIGETLKKERNKRKITLDQISTETKIAKMYLIALEADDIKALPEGVYARSFLRAYAQYLGLDTEIITTEFHKQFEIKPHSLLIMEQNKQDEQSFVRERRRNAFFLTVLGIVVAGVAYVVWSLFFAVKIDRSNQVLDPVDAGLANQPYLGTAVPQGPQEAENSVDPANLAAPTTDNAEPTLAPIPESAPENEQVSQVPTLPIQGDQVQPVNAEGPVPIQSVFAIEAIEPVWIEVTIDGSIWTRRLLSQGETRVYRYGTQHILKIGDAAAIRVQEGAQYREVLSETKIYLPRVEFGPGGFYAAVDQAMAEARTKVP